MATESKHISTYDALALVLEGDQSDLSELSTNEDCAELRKSCGYAGIIDYASFTSQSRKLSSNLKWMKSRILYYSNASATFNILTCGDIHPHPSSQKQCSHNPKRVYTTTCTKCEKTIRRNQQRLVCDVCKDLIHSS